MVTWPSQLQTVFPMHINQLLSLNTVKDEYFGGNLIWRINYFWVIGGFYIGKHYCILHALGNKKRI